MISGWYRAKPNTWTVGYIDMAGWYPPGTLGGCCDNDVHEIFKCMGEIALDSAYVVENADSTLETWNCTEQRSEQDGISVTPSEPVVSRVHFNLRKPSRVTVNFATGEQRGTITTMAGSVPVGYRKNCADGITPRTDYSIAKFTTTMLTSRHCPRSRCWTGTAVERRIKSAETIEIGS